MACYYIVISSTHLRDGQLRSIKGVFRGPIGAGGHKNNKTDEGASGLYCELCDKQYVRHQQFDNHINSYDHHHKQRLKELKHREFYRALACRRQREARREERSLRKKLQQEHHEDKPEEHCAPGSGPMFRSTTVAVEPDSAVEKWKDARAGDNGGEGVRTLASDPQSSLLLPLDAALGKRLLNDTRWSSNGVQKPDPSQNDAYDKLPWAPSFLSDKIPAKDENKSFVTSRGRPVCFSLPKRSCVLLHRSAAIFIQAGRSAREGKKTMHRADGKLGQLDENMKASLSLCKQHQHGTGAQVHVGGGTGAQDDGMNGAAVVGGGWTGARGGGGTVSAGSGTEQVQGTHQTFAGDLKSGQSELLDVGTQIRGGKGCGDVNGEGGRTDAQDGGCYGGPNDQIAVRGSNGAGQTLVGIDVTQDYGGVEHDVRLILRNGNEAAVGSGSGIRDKSAGIQTGFQTRAQSHGTGARVTEGRDERGTELTQNGGPATIGILETIQSGIGTQSSNDIGTAHNHDVSTLEGQNSSDFIQKLHSCTPTQLQQSEPANHVKNLNPEQCSTSPCRPKEPFCPVLSRHGKHVLPWPTEMVRYTRTSPSLSYGVNPLFYDFRAHAGGKKPSVIKRADRVGCGEGGGEVKPDQSLDENEGGRAGNPAPLPNGDPLKSTRVELGRRKRRKRGGLRKRGRRRRRRDEMKREEKGRRGIMSGLCQRKREDAGTEERRGKRPLSRRMLAGPEKTTAGGTGNGELLSRLAAKRFNRSKRVSEEAGPRPCEQSSSRWGPAFTKLLCGEAPSNAPISPAIQTPRRPAITDDPVVVVVADGDERGREDKRRGNLGEISAREATASEPPISAGSSPRRDAACERQIHLGPSLHAEAPCDGAISPGSLSFRGPAGVRSQTATDVDKDASPEVRGGEKRKWIECSEINDVKKCKRGQGLDMSVFDFEGRRTLDNLATREGEAKEANPSQSLAIRTDSVCQENDKRMDVAPEDATHKDDNQQCSHRETNPSHSSPERPQNIPIQMHDQSCLSPKDIKTFDSVNTKTVHVPPNKSTPPVDTPISESNHPPRSVNSAQSSPKDKMPIDGRPFGRLRDNKTAEHIYPEKRPSQRHNFPPRCLPLQAPLLLPPPSSFSFHHHTIIQHHLTLMPPPLPLPSYPHLLPPFAPHPLPLNPPPPPPPPAPSFFASPPIRFLDAPYALAREFHPHPALLGPPHPAALPLQVLF
ncbi:uncharacterized protein LOC144205081 [Stigmatopora nigra]